MPTTTNKGYSVQTAGSNPGTWGAGSSESLNEGVIELLDDDLGGLNTTSLSSTDEELTIDEGRCLMQRLTGTLLANVKVTNPNVGFNVYENATTGNFTVTVEFTGGVGGSIVVPQGGAVFTVADGTNGIRAIPNATVKAMIASGDLTPSTITGNQNNYAPTGHADAFRFRLATDATRTITGLAGGKPGRIVVIANVGSNNIVLTHEDSSSTAGNRFLVGSQGLVIGPDESAAFQYDATSQRWRRLVSQSLTNVLLPGYADFSEISDPSSPSADTIRFFAIDEDGQTNLAFKRSDGTVGKIRPATQAEMEAATANDVFVSPGRQHNHPGSAKAWGLVQSGGTLSANYGVSSVNKTATGTYQITLSTAMSSVNYAVQVTSHGSNAHGAYVTISSATVFVVTTTQDSPFDKVDATFSFVVLGDQ